MVAGNNKLALGITPETRDAVLAHLTLPERMEYAQASKSAAEVRHGILPVGSQGRLGSEEEAKDRRLHDVSRNVQVSD